MKKLGLFYITLSILSCTANIEPQYPERIVEYKLQSLYDIAKFEIYKNSSNNTCSCSGFFFESDDKNDTLNILSCDLSLDTIFQSADTTSIFLSFVNNNRQKVYYIENLSNDCFHCIGIQFIGNKLYKAYFSEEGYLLYGDQKDFHTKDSLFLSNIKLLDYSLKNNFLQEYATRKNK